MKVSTTFLSIIFSTLFISCGSTGKKDADKTPGNAGKLQGAWEIKRATSGSGSLDSMNIGTLYTFGKDTLLTLGSGLFKNPGITHITDSTFTFQAIGNDLKFGYHYEMIGDTLVVRIDGGDQVFYLTRK